MTTAMEMEMEDYCDDIELINFYKWLDRIPFSRPKRNFGKDFSDGGKTAKTLLNGMLIYFVVNWYEGYLNGMFIHCAVNGNHILFYSLPHPF